MLFSNWLQALVFGIIQISLLSLFIIAYIDVLEVEKQIFDRNMKSPN